MDKDSGGGGGFGGGGGRGGGRGRGRGGGGGQGQGPPPDMPPERPKREGSGGSSGTSGISSGGAMSETSSQDSGERHVTRPLPAHQSQSQSQSPGGYLLAMCERGEWLVFEQRLRVLEKGAPAISFADPDHGITPLMVAVKENRTTVIEKLLELGVSVSEQAKDGRMVLHFAACHSREDTIRLLLSRKADPFATAGPYNQLPLHMACGRHGAPVGAVQTLLRASGKDARFLRDKNGSLPLFLAVEAGNLGVTKELLTQSPEQQLKAYKPTSGDTALHMACRLREQDIVKILLENGAAIDAKNREGQTALHLAAYEGDETMVKYLVSMKSNSNILDKEDKSPLHLATEQGHTNIVDLLIDKYKTSVAARTKDGNTLMHIASSFGHPETALAFLKRGVPLLMPNKEGAICLHSAAMRGHVAVVKALMQKGASADAKTKSGYTALHLAVEHCKPQVVQILLGYGAQIDLKGGLNNETPLHIAARIKEGEKCAEMLLKSGANVNAAKENGETPLHVAARFGQLNMIPALLDDGADPMQVSKNGETPVHVAVRFCHLQAMTTLLHYVSTQKSRMDAVMLANQANYEGETAVHLSALLSQVQAHDEFEDTDIINHLLDFQGDLNVQTRLTSETPLHYCARAGNTHIMLEMVRHIKASNLQGAINKQDRNGQSPLLVASEHGHMDIVKILLKHHSRVDVFDEVHQEGLHSSSYTPGYVRPILPGSSAMVNLPASMAGNYTVDIDECGSACQSVMLMKLITSTSGSMCSASNSFASCVRVMCDTGFKLPPSAYEYLQSVYRSHQDSCDTYATTPPHTPISGVDRVVLAIGKFAQELFSRCTGFEACVRQELALGMDFNETTACNTDRTLQTCVNSKCPTSQANKGYLLNVFYYRMEQKGYLCEKSGFQYSPDVTTTSTTTATTTTTTTTTTTRAPTTTQVVHPSCSDGINFCDEYSGPAVIECSMQDRYIQCITGKCNLQGRRVPIFLLRKLEWEQRQMGLDCDLVGSEPASGAPEPRAFSRSLTAMLLTLSVVLLNL